MSIIETYESTVEICETEYKLLVRHCYYKAIQGDSVSKPEPASVDVIDVKVEIGNAIVELETSQEFDSGMAEEILESL